MIKLEFARDLLKRAVETQGRDFVYNPGGRGGCFYVAMTPERIAEYESSYIGSFFGPNELNIKTKQKTGCLIGVALDLAGVTIHHGHVGNTDDVAGLYYNNPGVMSSAASQYFRRAQMAQDTGSTWGAAYDAAEYHVDVILSNYSDEN